MAGSGQDTGGTSERPKQWGEKWPHVPTEVGQP